MKVVSIDVINNNLQEKIIKLAEARQEALSAYNIRDYATLSHLVDALCSTKDLINTLPMIDVDMELDFSVTK